MKIEIAQGLEASRTKGVSNASEFLENLWRSMSPKDPIRVMVADGGRPAVQSPKTRARKDRRVLVTVPLTRYKPGDTMQAAVRLIRLDPVAAALRGELYMQEQDKDTLQSTGECVVFLATYMMWNVLRKYKLVEGRKGKTASARYAFASLRAFRVCLPGEDQCARLS